MHKPVDTGAAPLVQYYSKSAILALNPLEAFNLIALTLARYREVLALPLPAAISAKYLNWAST